MRISVALATCNGEKYLNQQLESLECQALPADEIVISDDGSRDATLAIIESWSHRLPIRLYRNQEPLGITRNFEKAVSQCGGDIVFLCDQDDFWLPEKIEAVAAEFGKDPDCLLVFTNALVCDESLEVMPGDIWKSLWFTESEQSLARSGFLHRVLLKHSITSGNTMAIRGRLLPLVFPFPEAHSAHDAWLGLLASFLGPCRLLNRPLLKYRLHGSNQIGIQNSTLADQFRYALRKMDRGYFQRQFLLFSSLRDRLSGKTVDAEKIRELDSKIRHVRARMELEGKRAGKIPGIGRECFNGNYFRYSYGIKSLLQDLLLR